MGCIVCRPSHLNIKSGRKQPMLYSVQHRQSHSTGMSLLWKASAAGVHSRVLNIILIGLLVVRVLKLKVVGSGQEMHG